MLSKFMKISSFFAAVMFVILTSAGCGFGETTTVTVPATATGPSEMDLYRDKIDEQGQRATRINEEYTELIKKNTSKQVSDQDMAAKAKQNQQAFSEISSSVISMKVPKEAQEIHKQFISGYLKWEAAYKDYEVGYRDNSNEDLREADRLNDQAAIEVNQAVFAVNQIE